MIILVTYGTQPTAVSQCLQLYVQHANNSNVFRVLFHCHFFGMQLGAVMAYVKKALVVECCSDVDLCDSKTTV
jgi:hypothetical protein